MYELPQTLKSGDSQIDCPLRRTTAPAMGPARMLNAKTRGDNPWPV